MRCFLLILLFHTASADPVLVKDLKPEWQKFTEEHYLPVGSSDKLQTIYFRLDASLYKGQHLSISSIENWDLYINGKLIYSGSERIFSIDSLSAIFPGELFLGVHSGVVIQDMKTMVISLNGVALLTGTELPVRPPTFFRDYSIIATAVLLFFILALFKTNPQLTLDYFSFAKIFSVKERNENLLVTRITSSVNLLFYLFCALLTGFLLSTVFYFAGTFFRVSRSLEIDSLLDAFLLWIKLSAYILVLLASKLVIVLMFSSLFNFRETISFQFFNFLRFVLFTAVMMALLSLVYFIFRGGQPVFYERLIFLALTLLSAGSVMVLVKLLSRAPFSFFHLFSYLCASEIIPLVIIIKIFF